jgi:tetratricopeptide (TPR) repeat protein
VTTISHLGQYREATECFQQAIDLFRNLGDRYHEAETLSNLGDAYRTADDPVGARDAWQRALAIFDDLNHRDVDQVRAKLLDLHSSLDASCGRRSADGTASAHRRVSASTGRRAEPAADAFRCRRR